MEKGTSRPPVGKQQSQWWIDEWSWMTSVDQTKWRNFLILRVFSLCLVICFHYFDAFRESKLGFFTCLVVCFETDLFVVLYCIAVLLCVQLNVIFGLNVQSVALVLLTDHFMLFCNNLCPSCSDVKQSTDPEQLSSTNEISKCSCRSIIEFEPWSCWKRFSDSHSVWESTITTLQLPYICWVLMFMACGVITRHMTQLLSVRTRYTQQQH